ncbi:hypothetical protein K456DRAFT_922265 [Colletotrichum gloeosporioides 23]|nr:hypothetical protein K456DRAFT_922265 [Colletotrichum gloeosporioides 23]
MISDPPVSNRSRARFPDLVNRGAPKTVVSAWCITVDNTAARYGKTAPRKTTRARERQRDSLHNGRVRQYGQRRTSRPGWQAMVCLPTPDSSSPSYALLLLLLLLFLLPPTLRTKGIVSPLSPRMSMFIPIPFPIQLIKTSLSSFVTRTPFHPFLPSQFFTMVERKLSDWSVGGPSPRCPPTTLFPRGRIDRWLSSRRGRGGRDSSRVRVVCSLHL